VEFELITDSKVVEAVIKKDVPGRRANLLVRLFEFDFTVTHRKGELNRNADFFSRWAAFKQWEDYQTVQVCCLDQEYSERMFDYESPSLHIGFYLTRSVEVRLEEELLSVRARIAHEQRRDPKLLPIIQKLERALTLAMDGASVVERGSLMARPDEQKALVPPIAEAASATLSSEREALTAPRIKRVKFDTRAPIVVEHEAAGVQDRLAQGTRVRTRAPNVQREPVDEVTERKEALQAEFECNRLAQTRNRLNRYIMRCEQLAQRNQSGGENRRSGRRGRNHLRISWTIS
jgi:hypothetical protein